MKKSIAISLILLGATSCAVKQDSSLHLASMQIIDRNGFSETISSPDRLVSYEKSDFLSPQPYQKVLRLFEKDGHGKNLSIVTSYHSNGLIWQYLETLDGRAHGSYKEWHPNGNLKLEATLLEGVGDLHPLAHASWVFNGTSTVFDEEGNKVAEFFYLTGMLTGTSYYYHTNGKIWKELPYKNHALDGVFCVYDESGMTTEQIPYQRDLKHGKAYALWAEGRPMYEEEYKEGLLLNGSYFNPKGELIAHIEKGYGTKALFKDKALLQTIEYRAGVQEGLVHTFDATGHVKCIYTIKEGKKEGEEWEYYPFSETPKLLVMWQDNMIQGTCKTWYSQGSIESQKEIHNNKKHGLSFGWYASGELMLMEEYDQDLLVRGSYFKKGDKQPVSRVEKGEGTATLHTAQGFFSQKILYEKGLPVCD